MKTKKLKKISSRQVGDLKKPKRLPDVRKSKKPSRAKNLKSFRPRARNVPSRKPPATLPVWIERNIVLPTDGRRAWADETVALAAGLAEAIGDPNIERVTLMKATRLGFSSLLTCSYRLSTASSGQQHPVSVADRGRLPWLRRRRRRADVRLQPDPARPLSSPAVARHDRNTMLHRLWPGGVAEGASLARRRAICGGTLPRVLMIDEADAIEVSAEGDPIALAERRTLTFADRKIMVGGTPIDEATSHVLRSYLESDARVRSAMPGLRRLSPKSSGDIYEWQHDKPETAAFRCPNCKNLVGEQHKAADGQRGQLARHGAGGQGHAGFKLNALVSFLANCAWGKLAAELLLVQERR